MDIRQEALKKHYEWKGKLEIAPRTHVTNSEELSLAYPPGVAECAPGEEISREICERLLAAQRAGAELFGLERGLCVVTRE